MSIDIIPVSVNPELKSLTILIAKNYRNNLIQEFVGIESWLPLIIFYTKDL